MDAAPNSSEALEGDLSVPKPPGAEQWVSAGRPRDLSEVLPDAPAGISAQSEAAIKAISEGLASDSCTQLDGYGPTKFSAQVNGSNALLQGTSFGSEEEYIQWLRELVDNSGAVTTWEMIQENGMGVLELPGGERLCVFLPPLSRHSATFSLRKHTAVRWTPQHFADLGTLDDRMMQFLRRCVAAHVNILFVGQMGSGKSSLMRSLIQSAAGDNEKMAIVEQVPELSIDKPLASEYVYQPTVEGLGLGDVLDFNLYNGLSRLIVGEVHLQGITKMLETMILTEGSMSTYHAFSTEQAGERMKLALQIENSNISGETAASFVRQAVELVVVLETIGDRRRVTQISEIDWRTSAGKGQLSGADVFSYDPASSKFLANGRLDERGRVRAKLSKYGISVPESWFIEPDALAEFSDRG